MSSLGPIEQIADDAHLASQPTDLRKLKEEPNNENFLELD